MGEVKRFPSSPRVSLFLAEEQVKADVRQALGAIVGQLHGNPSNVDVLEMQAHLRAVAILLESLVAMRMAHS